MKELLEEMAFLLETGTFVYPTSLLTKIKAALAQPAQEPWCMKMNGCKTKCEDCPDEPAQTISLTSAGYIADEDDDIQVYQRPWVGLTEAQFLEATRLAENGNYLVAFVRIQEWLKEQNT
jgi:hypothetical protein